MSVFYPTSKSILCRFAMRVMRRSVLYSSCASWATASVWGSLSPVPLSISFSEAKFLDASSATLVCKNSWWLRPSVDVENKSQYETEEKNQCWPFHTFCCLQHPAFPYMPHSPSKSSRFQLDSSETSQKEKAWLKVIQAQISDEIKHAIKSNSTSCTSFHQEMTVKFTPEESKDTAKLVILPTFKSRLLSSSFKGHNSSLALH